MVKDAMPTNDSWDWPFLFYVGTVILNRSDAAFWKMKPRKLNALARVHVEYNEGGKNNTNQGSGFIDQVM